MGEGEPEKIRLGIPACLLGAEVRYDGGHKRDAFLTDTLGPFVEWVPVCPEVEIGLGVPRDTLRLVGNAATPRLIVQKTGEDLTGCVAPASTLSARARASSWATMGDSRARGSSALGPARAAARNQLCNNPTPDFGIAPHMKLTMLLCDAAQAVNGKLYVLGGGWNVTGPDPAPSAIAIQIDVPWDRTNTRHKLRLDLVTDDGQPVPVPSPTGQSPAQITAEFEVGRPAGHRAGSPLSVVLAINLGPLPLPAGSRYEWRCSINDETRDDWRVAFSTRTPAT